MRLKLNFFIVICIMIGRPGFAVNFNSIKLGDCVIYKIFNSLEPGGDDIILTHNGIVLGYDDPESFTLDGLHPESGLMMSSDFILLAMLGDPDLSGLYVFDLQNLEFHFVCPLSNPEIIGHNKDFSLSAANSSEGLWLSFNQWFWFPAAGFFEMQCSQMLTTEHALIVSSEEGIYKWDLDNLDFGEQQQMGLVEDDSLDEASGISCSPKNPDLLWAHNDSGGGPYLFALGNTGEHLGVFTLEGVPNRDWEDIASGPGPDPGEQYLYIGDIGDNDRVHELKFVFRLPEPLVDLEEVPIDQTLEGIESIAFRYPNNEKYDAETLLVDPWTKDIYIITKRNLNNGSTDDDNDFIFRLPYPQSTISTMIAEYCGAAGYPAASAWGTGYGAVSGDISPNGREILIKTYSNIYHFSRGVNQEIPDAITGDFSEVPYSLEAQGEAVGWSHDGAGYYTVSEEPYGYFPAYLNYYHRSLWRSIENSPVLTGLISTTSGMTIGWDNHSRLVPNLWLSADEGESWEILSLSQPFLPAETTWIIDMDKAAKNSYSVLWTDRHGVKLSYWNPDTYDFAPISIPMIPGPITGHDWLHQGLTIYGEKQSYFVQIDPWGVPSSMTTR